MEILRHMTVNNLHGYDGHGLIKSLIKEVLNWTNSCRLQSVIYSSRHALWIWQFTSINL